MNQPVMGGVAALKVPAYVKHNKLINWVAEIAARALRGEPLPNIVNGVRA